MRVNRAVLRWGLAIVGLSCCFLNLHRRGALSDPPPAAAGRPSAPATASYGQLPLHFEPNLGQTHGAVDFVSRGPGYALFLTPAEAVVSLRRPATGQGAESGTASIIRLRLRGATPQPRQLLSGRLPGTSNYFLGADPTRWRTNVPHYRQAGYRGVYPGIDLVYYGNQEGLLEHDFLVAPGADPSRIVIDLDGVQRVRRQRDGSLALSPAGAEAAPPLVLRAPVAWQEAGGQRRPVAVRYRVRGQAVALRLGDYDRTRPLVIDPVLAYSTYLGGSGAGGEAAAAVAVDASGNAYLTGHTMGLDFPTAGPLQAANAGSMDAFVAKVNAAGTALTYSTYLGGTAIDNAVDVAVDSAGNAYVTGGTQSNDFPLVGPVQQPLGGIDAFVCKLNPAGSALTYSSVLGGMYSDDGLGIAVDSAGSAYVCGRTMSPDFPLVNPLSWGLAGAQDAFIVKLNAAGSALVYGTWLGGTGAEQANDVAVDATGNAYLCGLTTSEDFAGVGSIQKFGGTTDAFVTKVNSAGDALTYSTFLGGSGDDYAMAIALNTSGHAFVTGETTSADFPTVSAPYPSARGATDAFVTRLNAGGSALLYSTYLGGDSVDTGQGIAVDLFGYVWVSGEAANATFPTVAPLQAFGGGLGDAFVCRLDTSSSGPLLFSSFLGGTGLDRSSGLAVDGAGAAYLTGETQSADYPTLGPIQASLAGSTDAFLTKVHPGTPPAITSANATTFAVGTAGSFTVTSAGDPPPTVAMTGTLPTGVTFAEIDTGIGSLDGTPAAGTGGVYPLTVTAANGLAPDATQAFTLTVNEAPSLTSANATTFTVGTAGTFTVTTGHCFPAEPTLSQTGTLPAGVTWTDQGDGTATLAGTPAAGSGGVYPLTVTAANGVAPDATQSFTLTVNEAPSLTSANATTFIAIRPGTFTVTTGHCFPAPPTITLTGTLPPGVTLTDEGDGTATLAGTPEGGSCGDYSLTLIASNGVAPDATQAFTLTVNDAPTIGTEDSTTFTVGLAGTFTVIGQGYPRPALSQTGTLPTGVTWADQGDGTALLAGTPAAGTGGVYTLTLTASNGVPEDDTQTFTLTVEEAPSITSGAGATFTVGLAGTFTVTTGHCFPAALTLTQTGSLPSGVTWTDRGDGTATLAGTPAPGTGGVYTLDVTASNLVDPDDEQSFTLTVNEALAITTATLPGWAVNQPGYSQVIQTTGGTGPITFTVAAGSLPAGLNLDPSTGALTGTPTVPGDASFTIQATDSLGATATQPYTVTITSSLSITTVSLPDWTVNRPGYSQTIQAAGGSGAVQFAVTAGALPAGLGLASSGDLTGTPTTAGPATFTVTATDSLGTTAERAFSLTIHPALAITTVSLPDWTVGLAGYSQTIQTTGGTPPVTFALTNGLLPPGLALTAGTGTVAGEPTTVGSFSFTVTASDGPGSTASQAYTVVIGPAATDPGQCTAVVPNGVAGSVTSIGITVRDRFGNPRGVGGDTVVVTVTGANTATATVVDHGDGTYTATYTPTRAGTDLVAITVGGPAISGSPFTSLVAGGPVDAGRSSLTADRTAVAATGSDPVTLTVTLHDALDNPLAGVPPADLQVAGDPAAGLTFGAWAGPTDSQGQTTVTVTSTVPATVVFRATARGVAIDSQPTVQFRPALVARYPAGLYFLGLPWTPDDPSPVSVLGAATGWAMARWSTAEGQFTISRGEQPIPETFNFLPGRGQWVRFANDTVLTVRGEPVPAGPFALPTPLGWRNAGNPFDADLEWQLSDIIVRRDGATLGTLAEIALWDTVRPYVWIFDSVAGYHRLVWPGVGVDTVPRHAGFWTKALTDGLELVLPEPAPAAARHRTRAAATARDWVTSLVATQGEGASSAVVVGVASQLSRALSIEGPPQPGDDAAWGIGVATPTGQRLAGELRPSSAATQTWDLAVVSRAAGEVTLSWPRLLRDLPRGVALELRDEQTGGTTLLNTHAAYRYQAAQAGETRLLRLTARVGRLERARITNLAVQATRGAGTTIQVTLSAPADVSLTVFGLGSRVVKQVVQSAPAAGTVTLMWDGTDATGRPVPPGTYVVEAMAGSANGAVSRAVRTVTVR